MTHLKKAIFFLFVQCCCFAAMAQTGAVKKVYSILDYGARAGLSTINTQAIQSAIQAAAKTGGTVEIPAGNFVSGPIVLKSGVALHLDDDAVLLGSINRSDYNQTMALIYAKGQGDIAVSGKGIIDGRGAETKC